MTPGIGHNSRQDFNGYAGRLHQWRRARTDLLGKALPLEIVRMRVRRAAALGLDYGTYASVRAATGRDIVALLFSSNALGMLRRVEMDAARAAKLARVEAALGGLIHAPLTVEAGPPVDWADRAPGFHLSWSDMSAHLRGVLRERGLPPDGVLLIGETAFESSWCPAAKAAGYVSGDLYFRM
ncbi:MAG: hypothetical protein AAGE03_01275 [Pseudomonadota bacterium]